MAARLPVQIDPAGGLFFQFFQRAAVDGVHDHAAAGIGDADNPLSGDGLAALRALEGLISPKANDRALSINLVFLRGGKFGIEGFQHLARRQFSRTQARQKFGFIA